MRPKYAQNMTINKFKTKPRKPGIGTEGLRCRLTSQLDQRPCCNARMSTQSLTVTGDHIPVSSKCVPHKKKKYKTIENPGILVYINPHYGPLHISVTTNPTVRRY